MINWSWDLYGRVKRFLGKLFLRMEFLIEMYEIFIKEKKVVLNIY